MRQIAHFAATFTALLLVASLASAQSKSPEEVARDFSAAYQAKDWARASALGQRLRELAPDSPAAAYNLACVHALSGAPERAMAALGDAAAIGFGDHQLLATDSDLDSLRQRDGFADLARRVKANHEKTQAAFRKQADKREPVVLLPRGFDRKKQWPVIIALHGFGGESDRFSMIYRQVASDVGAILVLPRTVHRTDRGGYHWGNADDADYLITRALDHVRKDYEIDESKTILTGFSQGASITFQLGLSQPQRFRGLIPVATRFRPALTEATASSNAGQRVYIMAGADEPAAVASSELAVRALEAAGIAAHLEVFEGVAHAYPPARQRDAELKKAIAFVWAEE